MPFDSESEIDLDEDEFRKVLKELSTAVVRRNWSIYLKMASCKKQNA